MSQYGFYTNSDVCTGCKTCVAACKDKNELPLGEKYRRVYDYGGGSWDIDENGVLINNDVFAYSVSVACMHCAKPACVAVCPVGAMTKRDEDGIVSTDAEICIGCGSCVAACPYDVPYVSQASGVSRKCDFCKDLLGKNEEPACVAACVMRCLHYGDLTELQAEYGTINQVDPLPKDTGTEPSTVFKRSRWNPDGTLQGEILNPLEEIKSETVV